MLTEILIIQILWQSSVSSCCFVHFPNEIGYNVKSFLRKLGLEVDSEQSALDGTFFYHALTVTQSHSLCS